MYKRQVCKCSTLWRADGSQLLFLCVRVWNAHGNKYPRGGMKHGFTAGIGGKGNGFFDELPSDRDFSGHRHLLHDPAEIHPDKAVRPGLPSGRCV